MLQNVPDLVLPAQFVAVKPYALSHQKGKILDLFTALDLKALQQLVDDQINFLVEFLKENVQPSIRLEGDAGQIDGGKGQISAAVGYLAAGIIDVADDTGPAAHVCDLRLRCALVILGVEGGVQKGKVGEKALGRNAAGQLEQVVVGVAGIAGHAFFDPEDLDREDGRFPVAQTRLRGQENILNHHAAFGTCVHAVVDGGKRCLGPGPAVHGVEIVDEGLHGLIGAPVGILPGVVPGGLLGPLHAIFVAVFPDQEGKLGGPVGLAALQRGGEPLFLFQAVYHAAELVLGVVYAQPKHKRLGQVLAVQPLKGFAHPLRHAVIKIDDALPAVLVV
jgi:hypothetical protein